MDGLPNAENVIPDGTDGGTPNEAAVADNPAWNDFLSAVPQSMHEMFKPHLAKWDESVNNKIQQVHSEYSGYKALKDSGYDAETLQQAAGIWDAINSDPRKVYDILAESYGFNVATNQPQALGQGQAGQAPQFDQQGAANADEYDLSGGQFNPEVARLQGLTETMANILLAQERQRAEADADAALDRDLRTAKEKYGEFDDNYVLSLIRAGTEPEAAVKAYHDFVNQVLTNHNRPQAPIVISGAGQLPSNQINPATLNKSDTISLVANMMRASNQQGV